VSGELKECGCYDGPYCDDFPHTLVSLRCAKHEGIPAKHQHSLMFRDVNGVPYAVKPGVGKMRYSPVDRRDV